MGWAATLHPMATPSIIPLVEHALPADCLVFKHSTTCPVSAEAAREVRALEGASRLRLEWDGRNAEGKPAARAAARLVNTI